MIWVPHPSEIVVQTATGGLSMGSVTDSDSTARFRLEVDLVYVLCWIRVLFTGGTSSAPMAIKVDSGLEPEDLLDATAGTPIASPYDHTLKTLTGVGTDGDPVIMRIDPLEYPFWSFYRRANGLMDQIVLEWTNPNTQVWGAEVGLADASKRT